MKPLLRQPMAEDIENCDHCHGLHDAWLALLECNNRGVDISILGITLDYDVFMNSRYHQRRPWVDCSYCLVSHDQHVALAIKRKNLRVVQNAIVTGFGK